MSQPRILLAGATGAVGREVLRLLKERGHFVRTISRSEDNAARIRSIADEVVVADATRAELLGGIADGIDIVVSCLGANVSLGLRERRSFRDVDLVANTNLLEAAKKASVRRFIYLSAHPAPGYEHTRYMRAHLDMEERIRASGLSHTFVRPTGIYSALGDLLSMARMGFGSVPGNGQAKTNPIHPVDVAEAICEVLSDGPEFLSVGGPEVLTRDGVMRTAFEAIGRKPRIMHSPVALFRLTSVLLSFIHPRLSDMFEFVAAVTSSDCVAPTRGSRTLLAWFKDQAGEPRVLGPA